jgi:hypothetical protein
MRFFFLAFALTVSFAAAFDGSLRTTKSKSWTWDGGGTLTKKLCNEGKLKYPTTCMTGDANRHKGSPGLVSKFSVPNGEWVSVDVYRNHNCADGFIALSPEGTKPKFKWGPQKTRISLQENCGKVYIYGRRKSTFVAKVGKNKWYSLRLRVTPSETSAEVKEGPRILGKKSHSEGFSGKLTVSIGSDQDSRGKFTQFTNFKSKEAGCGSLAKGSVDAAAYFKCQKKVGADERGSGYYSKASIVKSLPASCKWCKGDKCRRHCIQAVLHGKAASKRETFIRKERKTVTELKAGLERAADQIREAKKTHAYHTRKEKEWMKASKDQHKLDKAISSLDRAQKQLKDAQKAKKEAHTAKQLAWARRKASKAKHKVARRNKEVAQKKLAKNQNSLRYKQKQLADSESRGTRIRKSISALKSTIARNKRSVHTYRQEERGHARDIRKHEAAIKKHDRRHSKASKHAKKMLAAHTKAVGHRDRAVGSATKSHTIAKGKLFIE